jgi:hypothetical protein
VTGRSRAPDGVYPNVPICLNAGHARVASHLVVSRRSSIRSAIRSYDWATCNVMRVAMGSFIFTAMARNSEARSRQSCGRAVKTSM